MGLRVALVAGETSGDVLGAGLVEALRARVPEAYFEGIGGPRMIAAGCRSLYPMERLAVMGIVEVLGRYCELARVRSRLRRRWQQAPPDVLIGIDAPDFNLPLERSLRGHGVKAVHYVSPSVWAWREYRVRKIARSVDLMLTLFPFEAAFYERHQVPVRFVGHPLADAVALETDATAARLRLGLPAQGQVVALLPGSRVSELRLLAERFVQAAQWCRARAPALHFVAPMATEVARELFRRALEDYGADLRITLLDGQAREAMAAADVVLLASGTAALEALLVHRPMVVAYRLAPLTYRIAIALLRVPYYSLPNHLVGRPVVPELIQEAATPEALGQAVMDLLEVPERRAEQVASYPEVHRQLRRDASVQAAQAVLELLQ